MIADTIVTNILCSAFGNGMKGADGLIDFSLWDSPCLAYHHCIGRNQTIELKLISLVSTSADTIKFSEKEYILS
jgi:hypothetical protein